MRVDLDQVEALRLAGGQRPQAGEGYQVLEVEQQASVTEDERAAAEQADRLDLPARATRRDALQDALTARAPQNVSLHERYEKTQATFDRLRMDAEGELIRAARVVATTLARMRTSKAWWPAGALISRVLADYHQERGERTGIVTPYGDQVDATLEAVRDQELSTGAVTEVGTAHRFPGREFPIVVFDLVEDDRIARWMSAATLSRGPYERDGVRLFNVAITRAQDRLYIIGSRRRIDEAPVGSPLAQLALLLRDRRARTVPAARLVAPTDVDADEHFGLGVFGAELAEVLARHVQISAIDDEVTFHATFAEHLAEAERSIWL